MVEMLGMVFGGVLGLAVAFVVHACTTDKRLRALEDKVNGNDDLG